MSNLANLMREAYAAIGNLTPLENADCGKLCGSICCKGDEAGMLLFPGEEKILAGYNHNGFKIEEIEYMDAAGIKLLMCGGSCDRETRPFACRIFPVAPSVAKDGGVTVSVQADIRGRRMCPLYSLEHVNKDFIEAVGKAFGILAQNLEMLDLMRLISDEISELKRFY